RIPERYESRGTPAHLTFITGSFGGFGTSLGDRKRTRPGGGSGSCSRVWPIGRKGPIGRGEIGSAGGLAPAPHGRFDQGNGRDWRHCHDEGPCPTNAVGHEYCLLVDPLRLGCSRAPNARAA